MSHHNPRSRPVGVPVVRIHVLSDSCRRHLSNPTATQPPPELLRMRGPMPIAITTLLPPYFATKVVSPTSETLWQALNHDLQSSAIINVSLTNTLTSTLPPASRQMLSTANPPMRTSCTVVATLIKWTATPAAALCKGQKLANSTARDVRNRCGCNLFKCDVGDVEKETGEIGDPHSWQSRVAILSSCFLARIPKHPARVVWLSWPKPSLMAKTLHEGGVEP